jgi:hypothetical protein
LHRIDAKERRKIAPNDFNVLRAVAQTVPRWNGGRHRFVANHFNQMRAARSRNDNRPTDARLHMAAMPDPKGWPDAANPGTPPNPGQQGPHLIVDESGFRRWAWWTPD